MPCRPRQPRSPVLDRPVSPQLLAWSRPLSSDVYGVNRLAGGHEEPITFWTAEGDIPASLGNANAAQEFPLGIPDGDSTVADSAPGVAGHPQIAFDVAAQSVGSAFHAVDD